MSSSEALETLLAVRQAAEEAATQALAAALRHRAAAQEAQERLEVELAAAREDLRARRGAAPRVGTAAGGADRERFWRRLAEGIAARAERARAHREGPLRDAEAGLTAARGAHQTAREARELVQRRFDRVEAERRQVSERRAEAALDEQAAARRPRPPFGGRRH